jgi:hypothetical protein
MLALETLSAVSSATAITSDAVLEVGTYVGGATIALARGIKARPSPSREATRFVAMEKGGAYLGGRPPSNDILADWRRNVKQFRADEVNPTMIEGNYGDTHNVENFVRLLEGARIGVLMIDADGWVDRTLNLFAKYLAVDAVLIIDDYVVTSKTDKGSHTFPVVDRLCSLGYLKKWTLVKYTWIGSATELTSTISFDNTFVTAHLDPETRPLKRHINSLLRASKVAPSHVVRLPYGLENYSDNVTDSRSPLVVLEDGEVLGQGQHSQTRKGRVPGWVHSGEHLFFVTSDGSDPRTNGKRYELLFNGKRTKMIIA